MGIKVGNDGRLDDPHRAARVQPSVLGQRTAGLLARSRTALASWLRQVMVLRACPRLNRDTKGNVALDALTVPR